MLFPKRNLKGRDKLRILHKKRSEKIEPRQHFGQLNKKEITKSTEENLVSKSKEFCFYENIRLEILQKIPMRYLLT